MRHLFILTITCIFSRVHYLMIKWGFPVCVFHSKLCDTKQPNNVQQSKDAAPRRVLFVFRVDGTSAVCIHLNRTSAFGYVRVWLMDFLSSTDHLWWPPCLQRGHHHLKTEYVCAIRPKFDKITVVRMLVYVIWPQDTLQWLLYKLGVLFCMLVLFLVFS